MLHVFIENIKCKNIYTHLLGPRRMEWSEPHRGCPGQFKNTWCQRQHADICFWWPSYGVTGRRLASWHPHCNTASKRQGFSTYDVLMFCKLDNYWDLATRSKILEPYCVCRCFKYSTPVVYLKTIKYDFICTGRDLYNCIIFYLWLYIYHAYVHNALFNVDWL